MASGVVAGTGSRPSGIGGEVAFGECGCATAGIGTGARTTPSGGHCHPGVTDSREATVSGATGTQPRVGGGVAATQNRCAEHREHGTQRAKPTDRESTGDLAGDGLGGDGICGKRRTTGERPRVGCPPRYASYTAGFGAKRASQRARFVEATARPRPRARTDGARFAQPPRHDCSPYSGRLPDRSRCTTGEQPGSAARHRRGRCARRH